MLRGIVVRSHKKPKFSCLSVARKEDVADYALCLRVRHVEDVVSSLVKDKLKVRRLEFIVIAICELPGLSKRC